jgi:hypothetical protein
MNFFIFLFRQSEREKKRNIMRSVLKKRSLIFVFDQNFSYLQQPLFLKVLQVNNSRTTKKAMIEQEGTKKVIFEAEAPLVMFI